MYSVPRRPRTPHPPRSEQVHSRPIHLRIGTNPTIIIVPYGLFMGIGFAVLVFVSLSFGAPSHESIQVLSSALNITLISAVFFARLLSIMMEDGVAALVKQPLRTLLRPGFWLHGGLFGAAAGALLSWTLGYIENLSIFAGSLAMGLPLYETFSRIGCHTYGCCYGRAAEVPNDVSSPSHAIPSQILWRLFPFRAVRYNHPTHYAVTRINPSLLHIPLVPIQLISATLFLLLFLTISLPFALRSSVEIAGSITLVCHAAVRLITETYRADYRGRENWWLSMTGKVALVQAAVAMAWLVSTVVITDRTHSSLYLERVDPSSILKDVQARIQNSLFAVALGIVVYGVHVGEVGSWVMAKGNGGT